MQGAIEFWKIILNARLAELGGLRKLNLKYGWSGGDSEAYIKDNIIFVTSSHARGACFHIYLVDDINQSDADIKKNAFEVYGVTGGFRGWSETYGWIHKGEWVEPILQYLKNLDLETQRNNEEKQLIEEQMKLETVKVNEININKFNDLFKNKLNKKE